MFRWTRSTGCGESGCVEVRFDGDLVWMRNSEKPELGQTCWSVASWNLFLAWVMSGIVNPDIANRQTGLDFTLKEWVDFCDGVRKGEFEAHVLARAIDKD